MPSRIIVVSAVILILSLLSGKALYAQAITNPETQIAQKIPIVLAPGEELRCYAARAGIAIDEIAADNRLVSPTAFSAGMVLNIPAARYRIITTTRESPLLVEAIRYGISETLIRLLNPTPPYLGGAVILPLPADHSANPQSLCIPYPVTAIHASANSIIRGQTLIFAIETAEPVLCEAHYLGHTEPCYTIDNVHYYILLGISALDSPGVFTLNIVLTMPEYKMSVNLPFSVENGYYSFQFIDPPLSLYALMDENVMHGEENYLSPYRALRTAHRWWSLPLTYPLPVQLAISADYGDRRSYGGMVDGYHSGVDYRAWSGLPVLAPADGVVILNERLTARGNAILIDHGWGLVSGYWHLSSSLVQIGQFVTRGEVIGVVGNTGLSTGSHLHWETWVNGVSVDGKQWYDPDGFNAMIGQFTE
jgi:murein DD-endopeptidase MepM/ murein hydrolase activator NlpD